ncbi:MAG TPA: ABC-2 family transporter protein [bacterium]|nr:ABC-2 family transporter protein [bacterium]
MSGGLRLFGHYVRFNLRAGMEYRSSFVAQVLGMVLNNASFIVFWLILYGQLGSIRGYSFSDVMFLWALGSAGFGLAGVFLGNAPNLSRSIYTADMDVYLLQPRPILGNFLQSRMSVSAWGDIAYGIVLFAFTQAVTPLHVALFLLFTGLMATVLTAVRIFYHSLTFFLGNAEDFATTASDMVLSFMLYPGSIFQGPASLLLHSLIPAALMAYIPVELFKRFDAVTLLVLLGADAVVCAVSWGLFRLGLRAYESGNRMGARV